MSASLSAIELGAAMITASVTGLAGYAVATKKLSGKIATSEARELWQESAAIRDDYRTRLAHSDDRTLRLEERVAALERQNNELIRHNAMLVQTNDELERTVRQLRQRIETLEKENVLLIQKQEGSQ